MLMIKLLTYGSFVGIIPRRHIVFHQKPIVLKSYHNSTYLGLHLRGRKESPILFCRKGYHSLDFLIVQTLLQSPGAI